MPPADPRGRSGGPDSREGAPGPVPSGIFGNRYSLLVGLVFLVVAAVALYNTLTAGEPDTLGLGGEEVGMELPRFAAPEVRSELTGDANVDPERACELDLEGAVSICDLHGRPFVVSFWFIPGADCTEQQDALSDVARKYSGRVGFLSVNVRDERERVAELARERNWQMPVVHDRDGAVSNLYQVGGCPTFAFATADGRLHEAVIGELDREQLRDRVEDLLAAGRR